MKVPSKKFTGVLAVILSSLILGGATAAALNAAPAGTAVSAAAAAETVDNTSGEKSVIKDETVYVLASANGSVQKIIVSDWLKNSLYSGTIEDCSELSGIVNVKGEEAFNGSGGSMIWNAGGKDIYYQGETSKALPVDMSVVFTLDGQEISPAELAGKSGRVTIRFNYTNNSFETVKINGKDEKIYVPYAMLTAALLDNDVFRNVEVTNGKMLNEGDHTIVVGTAFPGLQDNLGVDREKLEIPDYVEITADVTDFEMANTVTAAVNEVFSSVDTEKLSVSGDLDSALEELTSAMEQLTDGSGQLYDGLCTLLEKSGELVNGVNALADGSQQLKDGAVQLNDGAAELSGGAVQLADGLAEITSNNDALNDGAKQVFDTLLNTAETQLKAAGMDVPKLTVENYNAVLDNVIASLDRSEVEKTANKTARETVTAKVNEQQAQITSAVTEAVKQQVSEQVTAAVRENVTAQVLASMGMTADSLAKAPAEVQAQINAAVDGQMTTDNVKGLISGTIEEKMSSDDIKALISSKTEEQKSAVIEQQLASQEVKDSIAAALSKAEAGKQTITDLKAQINSYNEFYQGLAAYTEGVQTAKEGADKLSQGAGSLKDGTAALTDGANSLNEGILKLKNSTPALIDGITQLKDGSLKLNEGIREFDEKGISKLVSAVDGDLSGLVDRFKATVEVSKGYKSFSGISDGMDGSVKFIYRTDDIQK